MSERIILETVKSWGVEYTPEGLQELDTEIRHQRAMTRDPATRLRLISFIAMIHIARMEM